MVIVDIEILFRNDKVLYGSKMSNSKEETTKLRKEIGTHIFDLS